MREKNFQSTRWSLVRRVGAGDEVGTKALADLCEIYHKPVHRFITHHCGHKSSADDLTQSFFEHILKNRSVGKPDETRGKFRTYLLNAVQHFLWDQWRRETANKRGGKNLAFDFDESQISRDDDPKIFDHEWAHALVISALSRVSEEMKCKGKQHHFKLLRPWLDGGSGDAEKVRNELGLNANAFKVAVHRMRERFRKAVRDEISSTVTHPKDVDEEFSYLIEVLLS